MKIYISAPISGMDPKERKQTFAAAAKRIQDRGHEPVNPMELDHSSHDKSWESFMKTDLKALLDCDRIFIMPDGATTEQLSRSKGVTMEEDVARQLGIKRLYLITDLDG